MRFKNINDVPKQFHKHYHYMKSIVENGRIPDNIFPDELLIEITNRCNLKCKMCPKWRWNIKNRDKLDGSLSLPRLKKLFKELRGLGFKTITLYGGEPLMSRDLPAIIEHISRLGLNGILLTNGVNFTDEIIKLLCENNWNIDISIDGSCPTVHDKIRGKPGTFKKIKENIEKINKIRKNNPMVKLFTNVTIQKENIQDLKNIPEKLDALGFDRILCHFVEYVRNRTDPKSIGQVRDFLDNFLSGRIYSRRLYEMVYSNWGHFRELIKGNIKMQDIIDGNQSRHLFKKNPTICLAPCFTVLINAFGDVYPCCYSFEIEELDSEEYKMGNIMERSFKEVWQSDKANEIRKKLTPVKVNNLSKCGVCEEFFHIYNMGKEIIEDYREFPPLPDRKARIYASSRCNNNCRKCRMRYKKILPTKHIKSLISLNSQISKSYIQIDGIEPMLRRDIFEIIEHCKKTGFKRIAIGSNGRIFYYDSYYRKAMDSGVTDFIIHKTNMQEDEHDRFTRVKGSYRQTEGGIKNLKKHTKNVKVKTINTRS